MADNIGDPDPSRTFWQGMGHVSEYLLHHLAEGELVGKLGASELYAVWEVGKEFTSAGDAALHGDWERAAEHSGNMANAAANSLTGGILGVMEGAADAAVLAHHLQGHHAPTFEDASNLGLKTAGEYLGNKIADAREVIQLWVEKTVHADKLPENGHGSHPSGHLYSPEEIRQSLDALHAALSHMHNGTTPHESHSGSGHHSSHHAHSDHKDGMSLPDHGAHHAGGQGADVNTMNITLKDEANYNATHGGANGLLGAADGPHTDSTHPAAQDPHHSGMNVEHQFTGHGSDANTMNANTMNLALPDLDKYLSNHGGAHGQQSPADRPHTDSQAHQGGHATHQQGMSVADHVTHPQGQGSDASVPQQAHHYANHGGGYVELSTTMSLLSNAQLHPDANVAGHVAHHNGMTVADHLAQFHAQAQDANNTHTNLLGQPISNGAHGGGHGQQSNSMSLPLDSQAHQGGHATHHDGMSVADHVTHPHGQGSDAGTMHISLHDQAHHNAVHAAAHDPSNSDHGHA